MRAARTLGHIGYGALYLAPIVVAVSFNPAYVYWLLSGVAIATCIAWLWRLGAWQRAAAIVTNAATSFANLLLGASLYVQGVGFNTQFFYHLDGETFAIARQAYPLVFFGAWIYWLVLCVWPLLLGWRRRPRNGRRVSGYAMAAVGVAGVLAYAPLVSFVSFTLARAETVPAYVAPPPPSVEIEPRPLDNPKSLVLIFAESLEATYSRKDVFGDDFTPRLTELASRGASFDDIRQVNNTGSTITGMVGALCALPLRTPMPWEHVNTVFPNVDVPLPGRACLGDVLAAHGYRTVFMGGAPLGFAGKGKFLAAHGFGERYGAARLLPRLDDPDYRTGWGVHDDTLIDFATRKLEDLARGDRPFALTLLTLDTHHPAGLPSASCPPRGYEKTAMEYAIRCSDRLLADFVGDVLARYDDVVVALFSDHLAHRNELSATLASNATARRLRFSVWGDGIEATRVNRPGTHYDVMPTILDFMGFDEWLQHNVGASLVRYESPWFATDDRSAMEPIQDLPDIRLAEDSTIMFEASGPTIHIDSRKVVATNEGLPLVNAIFAVKFDELGVISGFRDSEFLDTFMADAEEGIALGVSTNDEFNRRFVPGEPTKLVYFAGCFDTKGFVVEPLWWRAKVDAQSILENCRSARR